MSRHYTPGNSAAMREALVEALNKVDDAYDILSKPCVTLEEVRQACREARGIIIQALSAPPRNCDVGTAEDQFKRYLNFCRRHEYSCGCARCPANKTRIRGTSNCDIAWAQMPYAAEEGAGK